MTAPRCSARCEKHGVLLPLCDHCASVQAMGRWAGGLSDYALAAALDTLARDRRYYAPAEELAVLTEAARRFRAPGP